METYFLTQTIGKDSRIINPLLVSHRNKILPGMIDPTVKALLQILLLYTNNNKLFLIAVVIYYK
jgi:hypothetical protein